ncbi:hypothetical protein K4F52_000221 [Lecanicillium sp. MT-2017a]|nr:hypothetical protein K4F52_000221 [Lecanicillium sp. MT-2017a]
MSASDDNAPPSYTEAMAQHQCAEQDEPRPDGWVDGYVEAQRPDLASTRTVSEQSMNDKEKVAISGIKIGPLLLGLVERPGKGKGNAEEDE